MFETTQEQKDKYLNKMRGIRTNVTEMAPKINSILVAYGAEFYRKTKGEYTDSYFSQIREKAEEDIRITARDKFTEVIDSLNQEKENYNDQCFEKKTTTDPTELNFVGKELELMDREELKEFFELNFLDKNMVRLFDIEIKRRSKSNDTMAQSEVAMLQAYKNEFAINDIVIQKYEQCIKEMIGARSVSSSTIFFPEYDEYDKMSARSVTIAELFNFIHAKSAWGIPNKADVNILGLVK
ncbi:hypothetical protein [Anaerosporobacter sp.]